MPRKVTPCLTEAVDRYIRVRGHGWAKSTKTNVRSLLNTFINAMGPDQQVHLLERHAVEDWLITASDRQMASSFNKVRSRLIAFFKWCMDEGWMDRNPANGVGRRSVVKRERFRLSANELLNLPEHAPTARDKALIWIACSTGLRGNEMAGIRIGDLDLAKGYLRVLISKSNTEDLFPISAELDTALREWLIVYEEEAGPLQLDWFLIPARKAGHGKFSGRIGEIGGKYEGFLYGPLIPEKPLIKPWAIVQRALVAQGHSIGSHEGAHTIRRSLARAHFDFHAMEGYDSAMRVTSSLLHHKNAHTTESYVGLSTEKRKRDETLRGKPFLTAMVSNENVIAFKKADTA